MTPERIQNSRDLIAAIRRGHMSENARLATDRAAEALDEIERLRGLIERAVLPRLSPGVRASDRAFRVCMFDGCPARGRGNLKHAATCEYVALWRACKSEPLPHGDTVDGEACP